MLAVPILPVRAEALEGVVERGQLPVKRQARGSPDLLAVELDLEAQR